MKNLTFFLAQAQPTTKIFESVEALNFFQDDLGVFISKTVETALLVASVLVLAYLIWGGLDWIMSSGDKTKYESARNKITAALIGLAIVAAAWAIWLLVNYFFGIDKKVITGGGGGRASSGSGSSSGDCWPFDNCSDWQTQFDLEHGRTPTVGSGQDWIDFQASQDFLRRTGSSPSQSDWNCRYGNNGQWCN